MGYEIPVGPSVGAAYRVLVVDDNDLDRMTLRRILEAPGHRVTEAADGREGLRFISRQKFDLVLLDISMRGVDGFEFLGMVRASLSASELPIIMVAGSDRAKDLIESFTLGANDYVTKPFDFPALLSQIEHHLAQRQAEEAPV